MEAAEEEVLTVGKSVSGNARPPACTGPPRMPAQTAGYAGPSNVLHFASDQRGIANYRMSVEAAEEEVQCMERNRSGNMRLVACTRPPKRPAQTISHVDHLMSYVLEVISVGLAAVGGLGRQLRSKYSAWTEVLLEM